MSWAAHDGEPSSLPDAYSSPKRRAAAADFRYRNDINEKAGIGTRLALVRAGLADIQANDFTNAGRP